MARLNRKGVLVGLVVGLLAGAAGGALATSGGAKTTTTGAQTTTVTPSPGQARVDAFLSDVAGRLGVDVSKLKDALKGAAIDQLNQAVKDGMLTQAQADAITARINAGGVGPGFGLGFGGGRGFDQRGFDHHGPFAFGDAISAAVSYLGLTEAQVWTQFAAGKSLAEVAQATTGKTVSGLEDAIVAAISKDVNAESGLSADQKSQILANLKAKVDALVNQTPGKGAFGFRWRGAFDRH